MPKTIERFRSALFSLLFCSIVSMPSSGESGSDVELYIISPADGTTVSSPVTVRFGLRGMGIAPAGVERDGTGHHHLLIDADGLPPLDQPIPADAHHLHFGGGQTEATLNLSTGKHRLQLLLGNFAHVPIQPPVVSREITITVE